MGNCSEFDIIDFARELSLLNKWLLVPNEWQLASQKIYNSFIIDWMFDLWCTRLAKKLFTTKKNSNATQLSFPCVLRSKIPIFVYRVNILCEQGESDIKTTKTLWNLYKPSFDMFVIAKENDSR